MGTSRFLPRQSWFLVNKISFEAPPFSYAYVRKQCGVSYQPKRKRRCDHQRIHVFSAPSLVRSLEEKEKDFFCLPPKYRLRKIACKKSLLLIFFAKKTRARFAIDCNHLHIEISYNPCPSKKPNNFQRPNQKKIPKNA